MLKNSIKTMFQATIASLFVLVLTGCLGGGGDSTTATDDSTATSDTTPPLIPENLIAIAVSSSEVNLSWNASSDNIGVVGYTIYRQGNLIKNVSDITYSDGTLNPATEYCYRVSSYDAAGNQSAISDQACVITEALPDVTAPIVSTTFPADGATGISVTTSVSAVFSKAMDSSTINAQTFTLSSSSGIVLGSVTYDDTTNTATLTLLENLKANLNYTVTITTDVQDLAGKPMAENYSWSFVSATEIDNVAPSVISTFNDPIIDVSSTIVIMFDESIQKSSLIFSGGLGDKASASWSQDLVADDTLTISAKTVWPIDTAQSLIIDATDLSGNSLSRLTLEFDVSVIHVSKDARKANDSNIGTRDQPLKTIVAAVNLANSTLSKSELRVALGTYTTFSEGGSNIVVPDGMRLMGGYSANWLLRNRDTYPTIVNDTSTTTGSDFNNPYCVITISAGAGSETRIDGLTLTGGGFAVDENDGGTSCGIEIEINASPTIENNIISGGSAIDSYGIIDRGLSPTIRNNTIRGSEQDAFYWFFSRGILSTGSSPTIVGNDIYSGNKWFAEGISLNDTNAIVEQNMVAGDATENSTGVYIKGNSTVFLRNNTIHGGSSYANYGVQIDAGSSVTLQNNTIFSGNGDGEFSTALVIRSPTIIENNILFGTVCIEESNINADPVRLFANNLYNCGQNPGGFVRSTFYYDNDAQCTGNADGDNNSRTCTLAEMNQLTDMQVNESNISVNLGFDTQADSNWRLTASSPASVKFGGLDLSIDFSTDKDDMQRTAPWSIGAYEKD